MSERTTLLSEKIKERYKYNKKGIENNHSIPNTTKEEKIALNAMILDDMNTIINITDYFAEDWNEVELPIVVVVFNYLYTIYAEGDGNGYTKLDESQKAFFNKYINKNSSSGIATDSHSQKSVNEDKNSSSSVATDSHSQKYVNEDKNSRSRVATDSHPNIDDNYGPRFVLMPRTYIQVPKTWEEHRAIVKKNIKKANSNETWSDSFSIIRPWLLVDPEISSIFGYDELYTQYSDVTPKTFVKEHWRIKQRWGGKKRTRKHKTRVKKTRRVMRRRETRD
jgi:hypothetical protein